MREFQRFPPFSLPTATLEPGEAKYFHGREKILGNFKRLMDRAVQAKARTTVMIQAAPGAGKTALLTECARLARARRWQIAEIDPDGLYNPAELSSALRLPLPPKRQEVTKGEISSFYMGHLRLRIICLDLWISSRRGGSRCCS